MFSIDQNCHSLWDVAPKLAALAHAGRPVTHFVEDIDVAFTELGGQAGNSLRVVRERFHPSGGQDWGAALFYSEFLGRLPVEIRQFEPMLGAKIKVVARELDRSLDDLYDEFSPGDNWQLIGPSYIGGQQYHRVIGDLSVAETAGFLRDILAFAREDCLRSFPSSQSRQRITEWFADESARLNELLGAHAGGPLIHLYHAWLGMHVPPAVKVDFTSSLFALSADTERIGLLELFLADYSRLADLYNSAVNDSATNVHPLDIQRGELPFFATLSHQGHLVRAEAFLREGALIIGDREFPLSADRRLPLISLAQAGVRGLAAKAVLLVIQARVGKNGKSLALPYRGSLYMPAVHRLESALRAAGLITNIPPVVRVRFHMLDRMKTLDTPIRLPAHLARAMGRDETPARVLGENWLGLAQSARQRLQILASPSGREQWQKHTFAREFAQMAGLDERRRALAAVDAKNPEIREVWKQLKAVKLRMLDGSLRRMADDVQLADLDYWDSRGAILPWAMALGGREFYNEVLARADIYNDFGPSAGESR